jgi:hypothetical protein
MGPAAADVVTPDVLGGLRSACRWDRPDGGVGVADLARDDQLWFPAMVPGTAMGASGELGPGTVRPGAAVVIDNDRIDSTTTQSWLNDRDD